MKWDEIRKDWEENETPLKELSKKYNVKLGTLKSKKSREKWISKIATNKLQEIATKKEKVAEVAKKIKNDELNDKQKLFCLYYVKYFNTTKAYQKAYKCGYTTAAANGYKLLKNTHIKEEIGRLKIEMFADEYLDARAVLQKWIDIAFADIGDYLEFGRKLVEKSDGSMVEVNSVKLRDSDELDTSLLTEVKEGREGVSVKLADKIRALEVLTKKYDLLNEAEKTQLQNEKARVEIEIAKEKAAW